MVFPRETRVGVLATSAILLLAGSAFGQNALGDGSGLDRSLKVGSGGRNTVVRDLQAQVRYNNAVITSNAGYGKSFHGYVGYTAPNEFRASLGSNDLYPFLRDTAQNPYAASGSTTPLAYQFSVSTGQAPPAGLNGPGVYNPRSGYAASSGLISNARTTSDYLTRRAIQPAVVGYGRTLEGQDFQRTASPLLGVNASLVPKPTTELEPIAPPGPVQPAEAPNPFAPGPVPSTGKATPEKDNGVTPGSTVPSANPPKVSGVVGGPTAKTRPVDTQFDTRLQTPTIVAEQLQRELARAKAEGADKADQGPGAAEKKNEKETPLPPWEAQIDRIRRALSQEPENKPQPQPAPAGDRGATPNDAQNPSNTGDQRGTPGATPTPAKGSGRETLNERVRRLSDKSLSKLDPATLKAMQRTRPIVPTLTSDARVDNAAYTEHMAAGQRLLSQEQFFNAEERFARALEAAPHDSLAEVGRIHSQLGAGLYLSAALGLRNLYKSHPEMVGARFGQSLFPSQERINLIVARLREALPDDRGGLGREAALLMAYLGYQRSDNKLLEEGLDALAAKTDPNDPAQTTLLGLIHRVWVEGKDSAPPEPAPPAEKNPPPSK